MTMQNIVTGRQYTVRVGPRSRDLKTPILARPSNSYGQHFADWNEVVARSRCGYVRNPQNLVGHG